ncbi:hypothetical protein A5893_16295 [Pedobacter psychrophilus]|uniref:Uncharacterized protein n=1 Tax=Pedobacter psychrophilus TaxID=1826909 RepID=A0A179DA61_9SPHI|nr:hypothetical protein [Pedobacter psychrophilus]OAQ37931.1 hypothetical protein A5893_16295 [Pedobacter psychrophilus]
MENQRKSMKLKASTLKAMTERYKLLQRRVKDVDGSLKDDTESVWISRDEMVEFLKANENATGIRIYFGSTGVIEDYRCRSGYENQTNLILVPTIVQPGKKNIMVYNDNFKLNNDKFLNDGEVFVFGGEEGYGEDDYEICPPPSGKCKGIEIL